jgi:hypothetical protein
MSTVLVVVKNTWDTINYFTFNLTNNCSWCLNDLAVSYNIQFPSLLTVCSDNPSIITCYSTVSRLGDVVLSVLATGPKSRGFKPGQGDGFLRAAKMYSTTSFGWEVKPEVSRPKILRHVKISWGISDTDRQKFSLPRPIFLLVPDVFAGRTARDLWWTCQELSPTGIIIIIIITMDLHAYISPGGWKIGSLVAAVLRQSLAPS